MQIKCFLGNSDLGDMNVLEAILGDGDETKDDFDKEIDANNTTKKRKFSVNLA